MGKMILIKGLTYVDPDAWKHPKNKNFYKAFIGTSTNYLWLTVKEVTNELPDNANECRCICLISSRIYYTCYIK